MARHKDTNWDLLVQPSYDTAKLAILMDIRDELKLMNQRLQCDETRRIPRYLRDIVANTKRKPKRKVTP